MTFKGTVLRETISTVGVIVSLVFVGYELMQANAMARIEANISSGNRWLEWNMSVASDADLSALLAHVLNADLGRQDLSEGETERIELIYGSAAHGWETGYLNYLERSRGGAFALPEIRLFQGRFSRETWPLVRSLFDVGFARVFEARYGLPSTAGT